MNQTLQLWNTFIRSRNELFTSGLIRSYNNPIEDFAELLVAKAINGNLVKNLNQEDYDVESTNYTVQVKSIAKAPNNPNGYIVTKKDRENQLATHYAFVFFDEYVPTGIFLVDSDFVRDFPKAQIKKGDLAQRCDLQKALIDTLTLYYDSNHFFE